MTKIKTSVIYVNENKFVALEDGEVLCAFQTKVKGFSSAGLPRSAAHTDERLKDY